MVSCCELASVTVQSSAANIRDVRMSAFGSRAVVPATWPDSPPLAMCGRLPVGKGCFDGNAVLVDAAKSRPKGSFETSRLPPAQKCGGPAAQLIQGLDSTNSLPSDPTFLVTGRDSVSIAAAVGGPASKAFPCVG